MQNYQQEFIRFAIEKNVLRFGEFKLKSGRISPYFFNSGLFNDGASLSRLGRFYMQAVLKSQVQFDMIFGPAYKGIPLASAMAISLADDYGRTVPYCFNRKEAKDHGEGGILLGAPPAGRVLIIDDVITAGTSVRESVQLIQAANASTAAVVIALDRQERGAGELSAIQEIEANYSIPVISIISLESLVDYLQKTTGLQQHLEKIQEYRQEYGLTNGK
jgi:orotate phosphoribosyltransferase